ncbi:MAG TPA: VOC family protein, partial [Chthoniobacterales bacterium]|nr:VOC family protein [Chthoniobacterales bacterium]
VDHIGMLHLAFRASRQEFEAAQRELKARGIAFHFSDHEISHSIYFDDPDGNQLEITTYEVNAARA